MDIFEIVQEGIKIQEDEIKSAKLEEETLAQNKAYKVDIYEALNAAADRDYDWFNRLGENQKAFQPFILNIWMAMIWNKKNTQKKFSTTDKVYAELLKNVNYTLNRQLYQVSKEMFWLLACTIQEYKIPFTIDYKKSVKKTASSKYNKNVINYLSHELYSSKDKILDMIDNGLITSEDLKEIEKDLNTLEDQIKK